MTATIEVNTDELMEKAKLDYEIAQYMKNHCLNCKHYGEILNICIKYDAERKSKIKKNENQ